MRMRPRKGFSLPRTSRRSVLLPQPVWPRRQTNEPSSIWRSIPPSTVRGGVPYATKTSSMRISAAIVLCLLEPRMEPAIQHPHGEIDQEEEQRDPEHVGNN